MKTLSKIKSIGMVGLVGLAGLAGCVDPTTLCSDGTSYNGEVCVPDITQLDIDTAISGVDLTSDNQAVIDKAVQDKIDSGELVKIDQTVATQVTDQVKSVYTELYSQDLYFSDHIDVEIDTLSDNDVSCLIDDQIEVNKEKYDVAEYLVLNDGVKLITSSDGDKDYEGEPYLNIDKDSIR